MFSSKSFFFFSFIFISWRLITLQYWSVFCHTLTWISHGFSCIPHPDPPSHLPLYPIPLGLPSAPGPSTCLMHPSWACDLFHHRKYTCFDVVLSNHPTLWMLSFMPSFSLSSFTLIKSLFSSSSFSAIRVVSCAYLRLLIFLPTNLIPACGSSSPDFASCTLHISYIRSVTIYNLVVLLSQFGISRLFRVQF